jgi:hypothetical protein
VGDGTIGKENAPLADSREGPGKKLLGLKNDLQRKLGSSRSSTTEEGVADTDITGGFEGQERSACR